MNAKQSTPDRQRRISEMAHRIWESEGRPSGQSMRHWLMAEKLVVAQEQREGQPEDQPEPTGFHPETADQGSSGHG